MLNGVLHMIRYALDSGTIAAAYPAGEAEGDEIFRKPSMSGTLIGK